LHEFRIAWRNVLRHRRHTAVALGAIMFGITALVVAAGFTNWGLHAMREAHIHSQYGHVRLVRPGYLQQGQVPPGKYLLPAQSEWRTRLQSDPAVQAILPRLQFTGLVSHGDTTLSFLGEGVDPQAEVAGTAALVVYQGSGLESDEKPGVLLGEGLAQQLNVRPGTRLTLLVNTRNGGVNAVELPVRGVFYTANKSYDDVSLRIPVQTAQRLLRIAGEQSWLVILRNTDHTDRFIQTWRERLPADQFELVPWYQQADFYNKTVALYASQTKVIRLIIAAVILLAISNALSISVMERTTEIGTAMALGANRLRIARLFLFEGLGLAILGGLLGVIFAVLLAWLISAIGIPLPAPPGMTHGMIGEIHVNAKILFDALLIAIPATVIAAVYPAWHASRRDIIDALRKAR
jgi:putative ABC transport system permease protein